jgi:ATP-dependent RNA helicase DDX35
MAMWKPGTKAPGLNIERASDEKCHVVVNKHRHLPLTTQRQRLPIYSNRLHILYLLEQYRTVIIVGETGCGKSTQVPQYLFEAGWADGGRLVACTQPRRVAAQALAARVAEEMGVDLGKECGYTIRFDNKADPERTRVKFMTDGILLREMMGDPLLSRYSVIMVDEAHERSIYTDVVIGLLKKIQRRRKDLRVIVSSATLDADAFKTFFLGDKPQEQPPFPDGTLGRVAVMSMEAGRMYPVDVHYLSDPTQDYLKSCLETVLQIHAKEPEGDILVFLTGADEVLSLCQTIGELGGKGWQGLTLTATPLFGALAVERQLEAFAQGDSKTRKVVVATNIAETSVTIPGIVYVIDSMFVKMRSYNAKLGIDMLTVMPVSRAAATQRSGRAGRVRAGKCYRLCTESVYREHLLDMTLPEMQRAELTSVVLQLKALGIDDILHFDFPSPPPALTLARALEVLFAIGALDDDAKLAEPLGMQMAEFPLEPMLAKLLLSSGAAGCSEEALTIAVCLPSLVRLSLC